MLRSVFLIVCICYECSTSLAQSEKEFCQTVPSWENIILDQEAIPADLPKILVITNRPYLPENSKGVVFPNKIAEYRQVTYLEMACTGDRWIGNRKDNLGAGIKTLDKDKNMLLFVHGHGKTFPNSLPRALAVKKRYDVSLILFDWPAKNGNFNKSLSRVRRCGENFYNLLLDLREYRETIMPESKSLNLFAHSLGNYYLTHFAVNGSWQYLNEPFIDNIIMNAPAVRSKEHGKAISLVNISKNKYVIVNKNDMILKSAYLLTFGKMLGNTVIEPYADHTKYIHFTDIAKRQHTYFAGYHPFENENPAVFKFYNSIINGALPDFSSPAFETINEIEYNLVGNE